MKHPWRHPRSNFHRIWLTLAIGITLHLMPEPRVLAATVDYPIVFVSRQIPARGTDYYNAAKGMPGVGPFSRFQKAAPGKLLVRETNGQVRTLVDGASPTAASMNLIDINAPDVSYDGGKIVFAGLPQGNYSTGPRAELGAWRIYLINVDGSGLKQLTRTDLNLDYSQFGSTASYRFENAGYDDTDPVWLPDGRICFSSTRWPAVGQYSAVATTNLYIVNADGSNPHRITAERNGADRPVVDPITGKIVYSRWWRNHRFPIYDMSTIADPNGGYIQKDGVTADRDKQLSGDFHLADFANRNAWHSASINPDGTGLQMFSGIETQNCNRLCRDDANQAYGGGFAANGDFYANFFPMHNMTEAAGFGGIRRYRRGANFYTPIIGITTRTDNPEDYVDPTGPSFGVLKGNYAGETEVLPDGRLLISWAVDINQDYGLYVINSDGSNRVLVYDNPGTTELRARLVKPRTLPPVIPDVITQVASPLPPLASGPYDKDGTFVFAALNVYANAPVDWNIASAIPVGSAAKIRFFIDHQRLSWGSLPNLDWPILLSERTIAPDGSVTENAPANVPLFEQVRSMDQTKAVPLTGPPYGVPWGQPGAAHVAGMNFGRPGSKARCMGCHTGHTMIPVPATDEEAQWTNLAPGATGVSASLIDRKSSTSATFTTATLTFPVPIKVRRVSLWGAATTQATVQLFSDAGATTQVAQASGNAAAAGGNIALGDVVARAVRVVLTSGTSLKEIEVIASGNTGATPPPAPDTTAPLISGVSGSQITTDSATIAWATDEDSDSQVEYGLTNAYGSQTPLNTTLTTTHQMSLNALTAGVLYHYRVKSRDAANNLAVSNDFTFSTASPAPTDSTAPLISSVSSSAMTMSSATITWATNEKSDSQVEYGLTNGYGSQTQLNTTLTTTHQMSLSGLTADTLYHYRVKSKDAANNLAVSGDLTFSTTSPADTTAPLISSVSSSGVTANSAMIGWVTDENADSQVEYGLTPALGTVSTLDPIQTTTHQVGLSGLEPGKTYYFRVKSKDSFNNLALSEILSFVSQGDTTPPGTVTSFTALPGNGQITLKWTNPVDSDLKGLMIRYRTDGAYPANQNDGLLVIDKAESPAGGDSFVHSGLSNGVSYYYSAFAYDLSLSFSRGATSRATPLSLTILSLSPNRGPIGAIVSVTGAGFGSVQGTSKVTFNGIAASVSAWSDTSITTMVPTGAMSGPVVVTVNGLRSNGLTFKVNGRLPAPRNLSRK